MSDLTSLLAPFLALTLIGFLGGTHCVGMCGGIVGALSLGGPSRWSLHLAYNAGRLTSYAIAGAVAGTVGTLGTVLAEQQPWRLALYLLANLMLVAMGGYLLGATRTLGWIEAAGQRLWRRLQPLTRSFLPARTPAQALPLGLLWGWLPCGLVYSALATALASGSAARGAGMMLAFGLGTLPNLLAMGLFATRLQAFSRQPAVRWVAGGLVLGFGLWGLWHTVRTALF